MLEKLTYTDKMKIYPKISPSELGNEMKEKVKKSQGIEIQFFDENGITEPFNFEDEIIKRKEQFPNLKEIIVHPPLNNYNIELLFLKDENIIKEQLHSLVKLSVKLNIELDFIYHTYLTVQQYVSTNLDKRLKKILKIVEGTNVTILLENLFMMLDEKDECSAVEICKYINHPNLKCCLDTTHVHCKANILKNDFEEMIKKELNSEDCKKYIKQIHFAAALNNDGYINKKTHGRKHRNFDELKKEYEWLTSLGLKDKNYITEVSEEDYYSRQDQLEEIFMLEKCVDSYGKEEN